MAQDHENIQNEDLGQKLQAMLSDPESMSRLAGMASALASSGVLSGLMGGDRAEDAERGTSEAEAVTAEPMPAEAASENAQGAAVGTTIRTVNSRHSALLRALKPYLGEQKQARIDQMMRLLQLAELADTVLRGK